jgi:hypothetical protein
MKDSMVVILGIYPPFFCQQNVKRFGEIRNLRPGVMLPYLQRITALKPLIFLAFHPISLV